MTTTSLRIAFLWISAACLPVFAVPDPYPCAGADPVALNTVTDVYLDADSDDALFRLDIAVPGTLLAEVSEPASESMTPSLDLLSDGCELLGYTPGSPGRLMATVPGPGRFFLRVRTRSGLSGGWIRLLTAFAEQGLPAAPAPSPDKVDEWDEDDDGDGVASPPPPQSPGLPAGLCDRMRSDDHSDSSLCASEIVPGSPLAAEIGNPAAADVDHFTFVLKEHATVAVESRGDTDTYGRLLDAAGHRMAADDDGGSGNNFRITAELCPGRYLIRVEGAAGANGAYVLAVTAK